MFACLNLSAFFLSFIWWWPVVFCSNFWSRKQPIWILFSVVLVIDNPQISRYEHCTHSCSENTVWVSFAFLLLAQFLYQCSFCKQKNNWLLLCYFSFQKAFYVYILIDLHFVLIIFHRLIDYNLSQAAKDKRLGYKLLDR